MNARRQPLEFHLLDLKALPLIQPVTPSRLEEHRTVLLGLSALEQLMSATRRAQHDPGGETWYIPPAPHKAAPSSLSGREARLRKLENHLIERMARLKALSDERCRVLTEREAEQAVQAQRLREEAARLAELAAGLERRRQMLDEREEALQIRGRSMAQQLEHLVNARQRLQEITRALEERPPAPGA